MVAPAFRSKYNRPHFFDHGQAVISKYVSFSLYIHDLPDELSVQPNLNGIEQPALQDQGELFDASSLLTGVSPTLESLSTSLPDAIPK